MTTEREQRERRRRVVEFIEHEHGVHIRDPHMPEGAHEETWSLLDIKRRHDSSGNVISASPEKSRYNTHTILSVDPQYASVRYWEHADKIMYRDSEVSDNVIETIGIDLETRYNYFITSDAIRAAILLRSTQNTVCPIREYLDSLVWDGETRIADLAEHILKAETTDETRHLIRTMSGMMWISFVARIYDPGCKVDTVPFLIGEKGVGKSTVFEIMGGDWFSRSDIPIGTKDALEKIHQSGVWLWEIAELKDLQGKSADLAKQFFSTSEDRYRPSYGKMPITRKRRTCFIGTSNNYQILDDGPERRYWILKITDKIDLEYVKKYRDQIWAEAVHWYKDGERWWLPYELEDSLSQYQESFLVDDPWSYKVLQYLEMHPQGVTAADILDHLGIPHVAQHGGLVKRIARVCRELGYHNTPTGGTRKYRKKPQKR